MHTESSTWKENKEGMSAEIEVKPRKYEVMCATIEARREFQGEFGQQLPQTLKSLNTKQRENVTGTWIIFCRQRRGHRQC